MSRSMLAALVAANPGPAAHLALLGAVIVIGLIVFVIVRFRRKRETAETRRADEAETTSQSHGESHDRSQTGSAKQ